MVVEEEEAPLLLYSGSPLTVLCSTAPCQRSHGCPRERSVTVCGTLHEEGTMEVIIKMIRGSGMKMITIRRTMTKTITIKKTTTMTKTNGESLWEL